MWTTIAEAWQNTETFSNYQYSSPGDIYGSNFTGDSETISTSEPFKEKEKKHESFKEKFSENIESSQKETYMSPYTISENLTHQQTPVTTHSNIDNQQKINKEKFSVLNKKCDLIHRTVKKLTENFDELKKKQINIENFRSSSEDSLFNKNIYDIVLFIIFGIFIILLLEGVYRILVLKIKSGKN